MSHSKVAWPQNPAQLITQKRGPLYDLEKISLRALIETRCPSVLTPFNAAWGLLNGHLQTGYVALGEFMQEDVVVYDRKLLRLKDGGTLGVDFTPPAAAGRVFQDTTPVVVALHGLTGGSQAAYVRNIIAPVTAPVEEGGLGYRAVVINFRGCAGVPLTSPQLYGLSHTDDLRQAIYYIAQRHPNAPLLGIGFSLGANILTRYVAEEGELCRLVSACVLACVFALSISVTFSIVNALSSQPWDIVRTSQFLESTWFSRTVYAKTFGTNLRKVVARHADSIRQFPDSAFAKALPTLFANPDTRLMMRKFDQIVSIHCAGSAPTFPFSDEWAYYAHASSHDKLDTIRVPFLALHSDDDPIVGWAPSDYDRNGWVTIVVTRGGGHMGWFQPGGAENRWSRQPALEWFKATAEDVTLGPRSVRPVEFVDRWLVEVGRDDLGCREIGDGGLIRGDEYYIQLRKMTLDLVYRFLVFFGHYEILTA